MCGIIFPNDRKTCIQRLDMLYFSRDRRQKKIKQARGEKTIEPGSRTKVREIVCTDGMKTWFVTGSKDGHFKQ